MRMQYLIDENVNPIYPQQLRRKDQDIVVQVVGEPATPNNGKQGYYIANILDQQYYYCGTQWEDVKIKLKELGIGRDDSI